MTQGRQQKRQKKAFGSYFKKTQEFRGGESLHTAIEKEIKSYLMTPEVDSDANPLDWWKTQEVNFSQTASVPLAALLRGVSAAEEML